MSDKASGQKEQRGFSRSPTKVRATLFPDNGDAIEGEAQDLSMNGAFIRCATSLPPDSHCRIELKREPLIHVEATGKVMRLAEGGFAVNFDEIVGTESFEHLQRLVLYNNADPEQVLAESKHHSGIRKTDADS